MDIFSGNNIKFVVGLGNPGPEYANTYHSVGFLFLDFLTKNLLSSKLEARNSKLLKSNVFMNESGLYVKKIMKKYGAKPLEILIAHDDSDLPIGAFKLSFNRSSAGHKGAQSVIDALGTKEFWRLRIGVRPQETKGQGSLRRQGSGGQASIKGQGLYRAKAGSFVLKKISRADRDILTAVFEDILTTWRK